MVLPTKKKYKKSNLKIHVASLKSRIRMKRKPNYVNGPNLIGHVIQRDYVLGNTMLVG